MKRVIVLLTVTVLLSFWLVDMDKMRVKMINDVVPPSGKELLTFAFDPDPKDTQPLNRYLRYYKVTDQILAKSPNPAAMLGYCYYYLGDIPRSIRYFKKAIRINPRFFWFYYNLGVIYMQQGKNTEAAAYFEKALACSAEETLMMINASRIYHELNEEAAQMGYNTEKSLIDGYARANEMLMICKFNLGGLVPGRYHVQIF